MGLTKTADLRESLETLAWNYLDAVREPNNLALLRAIVGPPAKFPTLGRAFYETGMRPLVERLTQYLKDNASPSGAGVWDAELAAVQFFAFLRSCVAIPMLIAHEPAPSPQRCSGIIAQAVGTLLRDHGQETMIAEA